MGYPQLSSKLGFIACHALLLSLISLSACVMNQPTPDASQSHISQANTSQAKAARLDDSVLISEIRVTEHRGDDDLLSAGLGLAGLQGAVTSFAQAAAPTTVELRRRAIAQNWKGIADLSPLGGYGSSYGAVPSVPGREFQAFARIPGANSPHRVLAQVPDAFDRAARCLVVSPVSGSRGIYGAMAVGGAWALPRGCAVVYTDKGAGSGFFDLDTGTGVSLDGTRAAVGAAQLEFQPADSSGSGVAFKHAHSTDNPEADWGRHSLQALLFGLRALDLAFPDQAPFTAENTRIIGIGISNGGGALLRAAELDQAGWFDAIVAGEPNITPPNGRPLFDYALEAAIYQPCAWLAAPKGPQLAFPAVLQAQAERRCAALQARGLLASGSVSSQSEQAWRVLQEAGWDEHALSQMGVLLAIDVWRAVVATYIQSYARVGPQAALCGYRFAATDAQGKPVASSASARAFWWADASGVAPSAGVNIIDGMSAESEDDPHLAALLCAQAMRASSEGLGAQLSAGIDASRGSARPLSPRVLIVHGEQDGLVPSNWSSVAYYQAARANNIDLRLYSVPHAQHFDAFLFLPAMASSQLPLLPYVYQAADRAWAAISDGTSLPASGTVRNRLRSDPSQVLDAASLGRIGE